jgi:hypothetical protein
MAEDDRRAGGPGNIPFLRGGYKPGLWPMAEIGIFRAGAEFLDCIEEESTP